VAQVAFLLACFSLHAVSWKMVMMHGMVTINAHSLGSVGVVGNLIQTHKCFPLLACFQSWIYFSRTLLQLFCDAQPAVHFLGVGSKDAEGSIHDSAES
jgi:hypothetical protein